MGGPVLAGGDQVMVSVRGAAGGDQVMVSVRGAVGTVTVGRAGLAGGSSTSVTVIVTRAES